MSRLPFEGYEYYIDSENQYHLQSIVPYSSYNYRVEVIFPVKPIISVKKELPKIYLSDFNGWVKSLSFLIEDENDSLYLLWKLLVDVAQEIIDYDICGTDNQYIRMVCLYVAHYLELHIKTLKDYERKMSLNDERNMDHETMEEVKIEMIDETYGDFKKTLWGQMFWTLYVSKAKFKMGYMPY